MPRSLFYSPRRTCHASIATASHATAARTRAQAGDATIINQITSPKAASPKLPSAAPAASSAAASLPRRAPKKPAFSLRSRTCFSIKVALAGQDRGKSKKQTANDRPEAGRDKPCDDGHGAAEHESDEILVPARLTKGGRLELNDHES